LITDQTVASDSDRCDLGISGVEARHGDHICGLYYGVRQRDEMLLPFLEAGLLAGDKCICVVDGTEPTDIVAALHDDVDGRDRADKKQLDVIRAADAYLRSGRFSPVETIGFWRGAISEVMYGGRFDVVRAVETWSLRDVVPERSELLALESEMNRFLPLYPQVILCLYDLERFGGSIVVDLVKTHSKLLLSGMILENPHALTPDEFFGRGMAENRHHPHIATEALVRDAVP
jgi:hypothetical protein